MKLLTIVKCTATLAAVYVATKSSYFSFLLGMPFVFLGGGGGGKEGGGQPSYAPPPPPAAPPPPTVDDAQVQADIDATNRRRAAATGLSATDITKGALAGDPTTLSAKKPTLLGGGAAPNPGIGG